MNHKHLELIVAWANGATIEYKTPYGVWHAHNNPSFSNDTEYRVMPKPNKELLVTINFEHVLQKPEILSVFVYQDRMNENPNVKFTFDGETGDFLSVEKI